MAFKNDRQRKGFFAQLRGARASLERIQEKRILAKTKAEEEKLGRTEKKLSVRLKFETAKAKRLARVGEERIALEKVKARERATMAEIEKFTLKGKLKKRVKLGAQRFAEERQARKEFLKTPEGKRELKESRKKRAKFLKKLGEVKLV